MELIKVKDYDQAAQKVAEYLSAQVLLKPNAILGLATGSTPLGVYEELVKRYKAGGLSFAKTTTFNLDEYVGIAQDNDQSYYYYMHQNFLDHVDIPKENTYLPKGLGKDPNQAAMEYEELIRKAGEVDIQLLGIGLNGHIGFNEPGEIISETHLVDLTESTIEANKRFFDSAEEVPKQALTMGIGTILHAKKIILMVTGENKADALKNTMIDPISPEVPASLLRLHGDVVVVADEAACALL